MGTRSRIGVMHGDKIKSIYCHYDGYLEHNGQILQEHYDSGSANNLVALGDISTLRKGIEIPEGVEHSFEKANHNITVFYGRDRGEEDVGFQVAHTFKEFLEQCDDSGAEYYYIMKDGEWYCGSLGRGSQLVSLTEALAAQKEAA